MSNQQKSSRDEKKIKYYEDAFKKHDEYEAKKQKKRKRRKASKASSQIEDPMDKIDNLLGDFVSGKKRKEPENQEK